MCVIAQPECVCGILLQLQGTAGGNSVRFFLLLCVGRCLSPVFASFSSSKGRFLKSIFRSELFCFWCLVAVFGFFGGVLPMFFAYLYFFSENVW